MQNSNTSCVSKHTASDLYTDTQTIERWQERAMEMRNMKQWSESIQIGSPIAKDLLPILAKDDVKQIELVMKTMGLGELQRLE